MNNKLLITETQIKQGSTLNDNIDSEFLKAQIYYTQERFVQPLLGTDLYQEIINQYSANTLTALNQILLDNYIRFMLINYTAGEVIPLIHYRIDNIGVHNRSDTNFNPVQHTEVEYLCIQYKNQGAFYAEQLNNYLHEHEEDYPLFLNGNNTLDKIRPINKTVRSAFYLGNGGKCCNPRDMK